VWRFICATTRVVLGGRPRLLGRAWYAECNDRPRMNPGRQQTDAAAAPVSADLSLTCDVPAVDLSRISRDGTDDGERSKGPVTCAVLMTPVTDGPVPHTSEPPVQGGALARERRARITRMYEGTNQTQRVVMARPPQCPVRSG
jgi:hypothetical protein